MFDEVPDMNPGKGMAQACHAQSVCAEMCKSNEIKEYEHWLNQGESFGTTIVLQTSIHKFYDFMETVKKDLSDEIELKKQENIKDEYIVGIGGTVVDPTYPIKNWYGNFYTVPMETCGFFFHANEFSSEYDKSRIALAEFKLHK